MIKFDEIHKLRGIPFEEYFESMDISEEEKERRIEFSKQFSEKMTMIFRLAEVYAYFGWYTHNWFVSEVKKSYREVLKEYMDLDSYVEDHIDNFSEQIEESTDNHNMWDDWIALRMAGDDMPDDSWWSSEDRAMFIAENEANDLFNYDQLRDAIDAGYTKKTWNTMQDKRVRDSHRNMQGITVRIDEYFVVNGEFGLFPGDDNLPPEETVNCRCWLTFS